ncbi:ABC transporter substrate-binding protein [Nocardiopsis sp. CNS-639]|uniref:ABC transporter substrate-binding protein n=1 Tax=Nocardiopsis sp. CNS-639 TaxID=1169153 RepID=UPI0018C96CAB|nr:ABC transporter substrate-binding protein [Nocardiopsis sp. CNS-639]
MAVTTALALTGCSGSDTAESDAGTVTLVAVAAPPSLDPAAASMGPTAAYYEAVYDTLLRTDAAGEIQPWLASDWVYNEDRTELTLTLRDAVTFTDGSSLTADVVVANLERFKSGTAPNAGRLAGVSSFAAPDDRTVVITLSFPDPNLLMYLASDAGLIASGEALDDEDLATSPVGSGAYVLDTEESVIGSTYLYRKNPNYWNPDVQHFDVLTVRALPDVSAIVNAITAGEVDVVQLPKEAVDPAEAEGWIVDQVEPGGFAGLAFFDRDGELSPALADKRVRQAINHTLDRPLLIRAMNAGIGEPTTQVFPVSGQGYDPALDERYPYDLDKAKELLEEAGYPDGLTISLPDFGNRDNYALLEENLAGADITVEWVESQLQNSVSDILAKKYSAVHFALGDATDWGTVQQIIAPNAAFNPFATQDDALDDLINDFQTGDEAEQAEAARAINEFIVEEAWFAPIQPSFSLIGSAPEVQVTPPTLTTYPSIFDIQPRSL